MELAGAGTAEMVFASGSYSKAYVGFQKSAGEVIGPAVKSTLPFGITHAGPSTAPLGDPFTAGIVGPSAQVPGWLAMAGNV